MPVLGGTAARPFDLRQLARFRRFAMIARQVVEGFVAGQHRSPFKGFAIEFEEHRQYVPGDDLKHLDWKLVAKSDRYYIKQYEEDTALRAYLVLDCSGSMGYAGSGTGGMSKFDAGRFLVAALSYILIGQTDSVGLATCSSRLQRFLPPRSTPTQLKHILDTLDATRPGDDTGLGGVLHGLANRIRRRALIVLISDLFDDPDALILALNHFAHKKHEVIVYQVLDRRELSFPFTDMTRFVSLEGPELILTDPLRLKQEYLRQFTAHQRRLREACHRLRIDFVQVLTDELLDRALAQHLTRRMRR